MAWACDFEFSGDGVSVPRAQIPAQGRHADWPLSFSGELVLFSQPPVYLQVPSFTQGEGKLTSNPLSRIHTHTLCVDGTFLSSKPSVTRPKIGRAHV